MPTLRESWSDAVNGRNADRRRQRYESPTQKRRLEDPEFVITDCGTRSFHGLLFHQSTKNKAAL